MLEKIVVKYPWVFVVAAFLLLSSAWATLIQIARKHTPQVIEVQKQRAEQK